jgi:hypothetical protein
MTHSKSKKAFVFLPVLLLMGNAWAQKVYTVDAFHKADVKVYRVDAAYKADLWVFKVDADYKVLGNKGRWYFTDVDYKADKKIFFVDADYKADVKIYFTNADYKAGWNKKTTRFWFD